MIRGGRGSKEEVGKEGKVRERRKGARKKGRARGLKKK